MFLSKFMCFLWIFRNFQDFIFQVVLIIGISVVQLQLRCLIIVIYLILVKYTLKMLFFSPSKKFEKLIKYMYWLMPVLPKSVCKWKYVTC